MATTRHRWIRRGIARDATTLFGLSRLRPPWVARARWVASGRGGIGGWRGAGGAVGVAAEPGVDLGDLGGLAARGEHFPRRGGEAAAISTAGRVELWKRATSLGGVESLIEHRASIEGAGSPCPPDLLRLSTGIEDAGDLYADLDRALRGAND